MLLFIFFFNDTATTEIYTLSYTTLFRSADPRRGRRSPRCRARLRGPRRGGYPRGRGRLRRRRGGRRARPHRRSEEHTSELQSRQYLVCRILLEKKNRQQSRKQI